MNPLRSIADLLMGKRNQSDYMLKGSQEQTTGKPWMDSPGMRKIEGIGVEKTGMMEDEEPEDTTALTDYKTHLSSMPSRDDYKQGGFQKVAGILAGGIEGALKRDPRAGAEMIQSIRDRSYNEALADWKNKGAGMGEKADIEIRLNEAGRRSRLDENRNRVALMEHQRKLEADLARAKSQEERDRIQKELAESRKSLMKIQGDTALDREKTRKGMLDVARKNASTAEKRLEKTGAKGDKPPSPTERIRMEQEGVRLIAGEQPEFAEFVDERGLLKPVDPSHPKYKAFKSFQSLIEQHINRRRGKTFGGRDIPAAIEDIELENDEDEDFELE